MNILLIANTRQDYHAVQSFANGARSHGDTCNIVHTADVPGIDDWADVVVINGVQPWSRLLMDTYTAAGKNVIFLHHGYLGHGYKRAVVNGFSPLHYVDTLQYPDDRLQKLQIELQPHRKGNTVIIAGDSPDFALWHHFNTKDDMDPLTARAFSLMEKIHKRTRKPIVYRPDPLWGHPLPIPNTRPSFVDQSLDNELQDAWALITYGSDMAIPAMIAGVPIFVLGDGVARSLALNDSKRIDDPKYPSDEQRWSFLSNLAYGQFSQEEFENGIAWDILKQTMRHIDLIKSFGDEH